MTAVLPLGRAAGLRVAWPRAGALALVLAAAAAFMFLDPRPEPIQLWDESRVMVNALEMRAHGLSLATTYDGRPDLWNTKPPLLVWAMAASMRLFGVSVCALRLPAMVSGLGAVAITYAFACRLGRSAWTGALAAGLLTLSFGFSGLHGARTADYDAPLTLFTTGYAVLLFRALHRRRPPASVVAGAAALALAAVMTKSVAGLMPGTGVLLYLLLLRRPWRPLRPIYVAAFGLAAAAAVAFFWAREAVSPGYLKAAFFNDAVGRFGTALDRHGGSPAYYLVLCFGLAFFSAGPFALLAAGGLAWARGRARLGLIFSLCMAVGTLGVASLASTKLPQYATPAYPFLAVACALALQAALRRFEGRLEVRFAAAGAGLAILALALCLRYAYLPHLADAPQGRYGRLFQTLAERGVQRIATLDGGVEAVGVEQGYAPQLRAYSLIWEARGLETVSGSARPLGGEVLVTCDPHRLAALRAEGPDLSAVQGCAAVRPRR